MSTGYQEVLERLREERARMTWTQREICQHISMGQAQYCKIENGEQYFSYDEVKALSDSGLDIHYIFTGQKVNSYYINGFEAYCYTEIICLLEIIFSIITHHCTLTPSKFWRDLYQEAQFIRLLDANQNFENNLFFLIRCLKNWTQKEMARQFGMDSKKLRMLEKGQCMPDSEILWQFYRDFRVPPSIVLKDRKGLLHEVGYFLERMDSAFDNTIVSIVKAFQEELETKRGTIP